MLRLKAAFPWFRPGPKVIAWFALLLMSAVFALLLTITGVSAGLLIGPMIAGIVLSTLGIDLALPPKLFIAAQAIVGCLISSSIDAGIFATLRQDWLFFLGMTCGTIGASALLGYCLCRARVVPASVAVWGSTPGGATAMIVMAQEYGADIRLVAVMIYSRVVVVAAMASILAAALTDRSPSQLSLLPSPQIDPEQVTITALVALIGGGLGKLSKMPAGALIGSLIVGTAVNIQGTFHLAPPRPILALAYALVGWRIGLTFTREAVRAAARAMPKIIISSLLLSAFCGGLAFILSWCLHIDFLTALLAASPGGMDSVAIIAATSAANLSFVMASQVIRFILVMLVAPSVVGFAARRMANPLQATE